LGKLITLRDWVGFAVVLVLGAGAIAYRHWYMDPREWGALCTLAAPPLNCAVRGAFLWGQTTTAWGGVALLLGAWAFFLRAPFVVRVAAVVVGIAAVTNYNSTGGTIGAAMGAWAWLRPEV
jgi:hypothetical protein